MNNVINLSIKNIILIISYYFFFQAEDGIRDGRVTGVQTCALPISHIVYVAPNPRTHYEQQLREQGGGIGPGVLSPEVKGAPSAAEAVAQQTTPQPTPARATPLNTQTPPKGRELRDVLNSSLATMRSLETRHSGPQPASQDLVPIQELLYRGQRAIERAAEIRRALKKSGTPPTRALVD